MRINIDIAMYDARALEALAQWVGAGVSAGELIGACIARAHDDLVRSGTLAPLPSRSSDGTIELVPLRHR